MFMKKLYTYIIHTYTYNSGKTKIINIKNIWHIQIAFYFGDNGILD